MTDEEPSIYVARADFTYTYISNEHYCSFNSLWLEKLSRDCSMTVLGLYVHSTSYLPLKYQKGCNLRKDELENN